MEFGKGTDGKAGARFAERFRGKEYEGKILYIGINHKKSKILLRTHETFTCSIEEDTL